MAQASELAGKLLGAQKPKGEVVKITRDDGEVLEVLVRQPSVAARQRIFKAAKMRDSAPTDVSAMHAQCVIECACDPATGKPLFTAHHAETLAGEPSGGWVDKISDVGGLLLRPKIAEEKKCVGCGCALSASSKFCGECGLGVQPGEVPGEDPT